LLLGLAFASAVRGDESVSVCHGYGCLVQEDIAFTDARLTMLGNALKLAEDAASERAILAGVIGRMYAWAGEQSDIRNDRGGNYADAGIPGKMDCIDHSISTTRLLALLAARGDLRWHRVLTPESRKFLKIFAAHWSAVIAENGGDEAARFVVDSWFVDNGQPAVILPLEEWKKGAGPDV
jgi:hypothetical protein